VAAVSELCPPAVMKRYRLVHDGGTKMNAATQNIQDGFVTARDFEHRLRAPIPRGDIEILLDCHLQDKSVVTAERLQEIGGRAGKLRDEGFKLEFCLAKEFGVEYAGPSTGYQFRPVTSDDTFVLVARLA
jgi:hypothetical protein